VSLTSDQERIIAEIVAEGTALRQARKLDFYEPYKKQLEFHTAGAYFDERAMIAGNQVGKSEAGGAEDAFHLTGDYPKWWEGHRFDHPPTGWVIGPTGEKVRDVLQTKLFGPWNKPGEFGSGFIPKDAIVGRPTLARGTPGLYDAGTIKWKDRNGRLDDSALSTVVQKSYKEGQIAFASDNIDFAHEDEEPETDIHVEIRTRLQVRRGISYATLTPLLGWTPLMVRFLREKAPNRYAQKMGLYDCYKGYDPEKPDHGHYQSKVHVDAVIAGFPEHLRATKAWGDPAVGEGKVFLTPEGIYKIDRQGLVIPPWWRKLWCLDFGGAGQASHPFAACLLAHDLEFDIVYLLHVLKLQGLAVHQHVARIREIAQLPPVAWPHDGNEVDGRGGAGVKVAELYKKPMPGMPGLNMLPVHATWETGGFATQPAIDDLDTRMQTGRFKACADLIEFFEEARQYHREKFKIVKENDDVLDALFKGLMMLREARPGPLNPEMRGKYAQKEDRWWEPETETKDIDPFTGAAIDRLDNETVPW
jgi:phage terminase large subunit-like protein